MHAHTLFNLKHLVRGVFRSKNSTATSIWTRIPDSEAIIGQLAVDRESRQTV
jgi:hypothetical protein